MRFSHRTVALQAVTFSSAALSATYYAAQAPNSSIDIKGLELAPWVVFFGATAFALDSAKPLMMQVAGTPERDFLRRSAAGVCFLVLFVGSMIAIDGVLMKCRSDWAASRGGTIGFYNDAKKSLSEVEEELHRLGPTRPVAEINALIAKHPIDMGVWRRSKECQEITRDDTKKLCDPILALYQERGRAARRTELEPKLAEARSKLAGIDPPNSADPQVEALSKVLGWDETVVTYAIVAILGFAIEIVACFGTWIALQPPAQLRAGTNDNGAQRAIPRVPPVPLRSSVEVIAWVREFRSLHGRKPQIPELQRIFQGTPKTTAWRYCKTA